MNHRLIVLILLAVAVIFATFSCSSKKDPVSSDPPDNPVVIDTGGVAIITGNPTDTAAKALPYVPPHPAPADKIDEDGFMRTRLQGFLNSAATVETVNNVLAASGAVITFFDTLFFSVSLRVPEQATREAADSLAVTLTNTGAFLILFAGQSIGLTSHSSIAIVPQRPQWTIRHLRKMRMPAAWNLRSLASTNSQLVRVIVPDVYASANPHPEIPSQSFLVGNGVTDISANAPNGLIVGNHGFHVAGIIGATFDNSGSTGIHPGAIQDISILSLHMGGLGWNEMIQEISNSLPAMPCLVSTSLGYNLNITNKTKYQRALDALMWRGLVANRQNNFLMFAAAGNNGQFSDDSRLSQYSLPWNLSAAFATPDQMVPNVIPDEQREILNTIFQQITNTVPAAAAALTNVIVVGSSDTLGNRSAFSNTPSNVRAVGEDVCAPCQMNDPSSDTMFCRQSGFRRALYDGTSMATPQIAGLAVYLWNIDPTLSLQELKTIITQSYDSTGPVMPGVIDAYRAVLSLDDNQSDAPVRLALFDVAGSSGLSGSDGVFDEKDLTLWFTEFDNHKQNRINGADPYDYSRYDLNGNGISAIEAAYVNDEPQRFDLDINDPPQFSTVTANNIEGQEIDYDENAATDLDILCYYAYSQLYTGTIEQRAQLCTPCFGDFYININMEDSLLASVPASMEIEVWRLISLTDSLPVRNADLEISISGATPSTLTGTTDGTGSFNGQITPSSNADSVVVIVKAKRSNIVFATDTASAKIETFSGQGKLMFTRRIAYNQSLANVPSSEECISEIYDTTMFPTTWSDTRACNDAGSNKFASGTATSTCTQDDGSSLTQDSSILVILHSVVTSASAFATTTGASTWGGNTFETAKSTYDFTITHDSANVEIDIDYSYTRSGSSEFGASSSFGYHVSIYRMVNQTPVFVQQAGAQGTATDSGIRFLEVALPAGNYRIEILGGGGSSVSVGGLADNTLQVSSDLNASATITIGGARSPLRR